MNAWTLATACLSLVVYPARAYAAEEEESAGARPDENSSGSEIGVALLGAFGAGGKYEDSPVNRYGVGFGARAGVTLEAPRIYLGLSFIRFLGGEDPSGEFHTSTLDTELGYDFRLMGDRVAIRPELGIGVAQPVTIQSDNAGYPLAFHWAPGLVVDVRFSSLLISTGVRRDFIGDDWSNAVTFMLGAGAVF